jgi:hypothetical protein
MVNEICCRVAPNASAISGKPVARMGLRAAERKL